MKRLLYIASALWLLLTVSCVKEEPVSVEFAQQSYNLVVGDTLDMLSVLTVKNSSEKPVFESSNDSVAFFKGDILIAKAAGQCVITATVEGVNAHCDVMVSNVLADSINVVCPDKILVGEAWTSVTARVNPKNYNVENLSWTFTPSVEELQLEYEKVTAAEYKIRAKGFVKGGIISVKVADKLSDVSQSAEIGVIKDGVKASKITLDIADRLTYGDDVHTVMKATVIPENYDLENLIWTFTPSSEDLNVKYEKVSGGEYKFSFLSHVKDAYVEVLVEDGFSETFNTGKLKVIDRMPDGPKVFALSPETLTLPFVEDAEPVKLTLTCEPADYDSHLIRWSSSDEKVATVDNGIVTPKGVGKADIKVKDIVSGKEAVCVVEIVKPTDGAVVIKRITLNETSLKMRVGEKSVQLQASCYDEADNLVENYSELEWTAEQMQGENGLVDVVAVSQVGVVEAKNPGYTYIIVADKKNKAVKAKCDVTVERALIPVEEVVILASSELVRVGETLKLNVTVNPSEADDKTLVFKSSDDKIATVSSEGVVTGVSKGVVEISATSANGVEGKCTLNIVKDIAFGALEVDLLRGAEKKLELIYYNDAVKTMPVTWTTSDDNVVSVDETGMLTANNEGTAVIKAAVDGDEAECTVVVSKDPVEFEIKLFVEEDVTKKGLMQESVTLLSATYTKKETGKTYYPAVKEWKSSAPDIASVDADGNVTAVAEHIEKSGFENGKKVFITHVADGRESTVELTIVKMLPTSIQLTAVPEVDGIKNRMLHGESFTFEFKVLPEKASQSVILQGGITLDKPQSDFKLEHENNTYVAENIGYANFTAFARDNSSVKIDFAVEVLPIVLQDFTLSYSELEMVPGSKAVLGVTYIPEKTSDKTIVWTSSNEDVASVNEKGEVMAHQVGEAVITAKHKDIEKTCKIKVEIPQLNFNIGDYYYSTGKISSSPDEDESEYGKVVGVIFSADNPALQGDPNLGKDHSQATHGLVVALTETASIQWQASSSDVGQWLIDNTGYNYLKDTDRKCGYSNTLGLRAYNAACALENKVLVADCAPDIELGSETSGWYLPSYAELNMLFSYEQSTRSAMISNGAIAEKIVAAGGTPFSIETSGYYDTRDPSGEARWPDGVDDAPTYWSSTESPGSSMWATGVHFLYGGVTNKSKANKSYYIARYIFAF